MKRRILVSLSVTLFFSIVISSADSIAIAAEEDNSQNGWTPFQFSIYKPVQLFDEHKDITGLRLTLLYGKNADITGLDLGLGINRSDNFTGIQIAGIMNLSSPDRYPNKDTVVKGIQIAWIGNTADYLYGLQIGGFGNGVTLDAVGIQVGLLGNVAGTLKGIQIAGIYNYNYPKNSSVTGIQIGAFNYAENISGLQIGLFNACKKLRGVQIGIINHIEQGRFPYLPILNAQF